MHCCRTLCSAALFGGRVKQTVCIAELNPQPTKPGLKYTTKFLRSDVALVKPLASLLPSLGKQLCNTVLKNAI